jgi:hypothetical protein
MLSGLLRDMSHPQVIPLTLQYRTVQPRQQYREIVNTTLHPYALLP